MATAWPSSAGSRAWDSNLQGVDVPMPVALAKKEPGKGNQYPEDTKIRNRTGEGRGGCKRERVLNNTTPTTQDRQGTGLPVKANIGGGEGVQMIEAGRGRKGPSDGIKTGSDRDLGAGRGQQRGGNRMREGSRRIERGTPWVLRHGRGV